MLDKHTRDRTQNIELSVDICQSTTFAGQEISYLMVFQIPAQIRCYFCNGLLIRFHQHYIHLGIKIVYKFHMDKNY